MRESFRVSRTQQDSVSMMSNATFVVPFQLPLFATAALVVQNNEMILSGKSPLCESATPLPRLFEISAPASTSNGKACAPFYSAFSQAISSRLWLPTETVLHALDLNSSNSWSSPAVETSWFSTKLYIAPRLSLPRIFSPSSRCFPVACTDSENTVVKSRKIRCSPTPTQRQMLKRWCGASRFVFNRTVQYLKQLGTKANWKAIKGSILTALPPWCDEVPYQIKSVAIRDACKAVSRVKLLIKQGVRNEDGSCPEVHFRSRKEPVQSFYVPKSAVSLHGIYYTLLGTLRFREALPAVHGDCRLVWAYGTYYVTLPMVAPQRAAENQGRVVALDPGIRAFISFFAEDGCGKFAHGDFSRIQRLCTYLDVLISRADMACSKPSQRLYKACDRIRQKIRHLMDELHHKVAFFLVQHYDVILLPTFETQQMVSKGARKLRKKSVRNMLNFAHYRFKLFLKHKAFEYGKTVIDVCEAYTSKTVSWTGEIIHNLGGRKVIMSKIDGQRMDRDWNGARNIMLRALEDTPLVRDLLEPCIVNVC